jgi:ribosomal-protein-alanine N-acetyltransferase
MLVTSRLVLREPAEADGALLTAYYGRNLDRFARWMRDAHARAADAGDWLRYRCEQSERGWGATYLAFSRDDLAAVVELDGIVPGAEAALLAYSADGAFEGRGLASEAVTAVLGHAFDTLEIERIVAHYHPENLRSAALLQRAGFSVAHAVFDIPECVRALMEPQVTAFRSRAPG